MDESQTDPPDKVTWFRYVPHGLVEAYRVAGWVSEGAGPSHHDHYNVLMRYAGVGDPENAPPMPIGRARVVRKSYPGPVQRWGGAGRR